MVNVFSDKYLDPHGANHIVSMGTEGGKECPLLPTPVRELEHELERGSVLLTPILLLPLENILYLGHPWWSSV